jgi:hypothetical protein
LDTLNLTGDGVDEQVGSGVSGGTSNVLDNAVCDEAAFDDKWIGEEDCRGGSMSHLGGGVNPRNDFVWNCNSLCGSDKSCSTVSLLVDDPIIMGGCTSSKISALDTERLGVSSISILDSFKSKGYSSDFSSSSISSSTSNWQDFTSSEDSAVSGVNILEHLNCGIVLGQDFVFWRSSPSNSWESICGSSWDTN